MLNAHQVRNKQRAAVRRREADIEDDEITSGELNLIPYLDIITNLMLFLLASVTAIIILGQLNTTLPDKGPPQPTTSSNPSQNPDEKPLKLVVSVTREKIVVWSITGLEGTLAHPKQTIPRTGQLGSQCDGGYMCETNKCDGHTHQCVTSNETPVPVYDYRALNRVLYDIAKERYAGKHRAQATYQAILMADGSIPYGTIISVMNAMRCKMPQIFHQPGPCLLPSKDAAVADGKPPVDMKDGIYDTKRADYDPDKMALFHDILFSTGFE